PPPCSLLSPMQSLDVVVFMPSTDSRGSGKAAVHIEALPRPLQFDEIAKKLIEAGYKKPTTLDPRPQCHAVTITEGPLGQTPDGGWQVNVDQALLQFYHKVFLAKSAEQNSPPYVLPGADGCEPAPFNDRAYSGFRKWAPISVILMTT
ncbi:hypothetical protein PAXRUDRAFT_148875, partial [Paxillus rubicundulus Ve08.2h10]